MSEPKSASPPGQEPAPATSPEPVEIALDALGRKAEARDRYLAAADMDLSAADRAVVQNLSGSRH